MQKQDIRAKIEKELEQQPDITSLELAHKCQIPLQIVEIFRAKITNTLQSLNG